MNDAEPPRVLICTPTYHRPELLKAAVESVLGQTYRQIEHVVVMDGCNQQPVCERCRETERIGKQFSERDSRFRFVALPEHKGGYGFYARNWAIENSSCPLVAYLDDDNWWDLDHLASLVDALQRAHAAFAFSGTRMWSKNHRVIHERISREPYFMGVDTNEILHRRELVDRYGAWKPTDVVVHNHDWELVSRWLRGGEVFASSGKATSNYQLTYDRSAAAYWYSFIKRRTFFLFARAFQSKDQRYRSRATTV